jgi:hypothetical protein
MGSLPRIPSLRSREEAFVAFDSTDAPSLGLFNKRTPSKSLSRRERESIEMVENLPTISYSRRPFEEEGKEEKRMIPYLSKRKEGERRVIPFESNPRRNKGYREDGKRCIECDEPGTKIYCGRKCKLPDGYTRFGTPWECIQKGIYVGKMQK